MSFLLFVCLYGLTILQVRQSSAAANKDCVKWGGQFDVPLSSKNVRKDCNLPDGRKVCCAATITNSSSSFTDKSSRGVGYSYEPPKRPVTVADRSRKVKCDVKKVYISSPQEERDLYKSSQLQQIKDSEQRLDALMKYVTSDEMMRNSTIWLARVSVHMNSAVIPEGTEEDREYLSRFHVTRQCGDDTFEWYEWIEPVNIAARHPFAFSRCKHTWQYFKGKSGADRSDVDYVLLQSGTALSDSTYAPGKRARGKGEANNHYFLDAGTSTFDSSLLWFTCGYSQRGISFNQVFGWEMTLLNPQEYWKKVPAKWKPYWHFYNTPISPDIDHPDSPMRMVQQIATPGDFVSFKLDIDHSDTEMPIALNMLKDKSLSSLVDEFFFELHFQCDVMTSCGW
eukprot:CAMPEP_0119037586 /NCGR_PEP_ID=MMETSP1177-20130426/6029_1 /TAXON_ID=2985 /ORGANISM="Ochromonas sp, Strain CCMP1899" /LENGTH=394 /DNA_ID=CAMNT_0006999067 /DNA_START=137 /DNA_END=1318 /DNA_ORIENTATION=+